jgi:hypothetical protein
MTDLDLGSWWWIIKNLPDPPPPIGEVANWLLIYSLASGDSEVDINVRRAVSPMLAKKFGEAQKAFEQGSRG